MPFVSPPILPAVIAVSEHDELNALWKHRVALYGNLNSSEDELSDSSSSIHLFGDERDRPFKSSDVSDNVSGRPRYSTAVDMIAAAEVTLAKSGTKTPFTESATSVASKAKSAPEPKFSPWMDPIDPATRDDALIARHLEKQKKRAENRNLNFQPGGSVSTRNT